MADSTLLNQIQNDGSSAADQQYLRSSILSELKNVHTMLPGIISKYDATLQTVEVQPSIKRIFIGQGAVNLPLCVDVPVVFPQGGNFAITFPIAAGDECLIFFSERAIDYMFEFGGIQEPSEYRMHDLSDGFAFIGFNSKPRKLSSVQTDGAELRTRDRSKYLKITADGFIINGNITLTGNITQTGSITSTGDHTAQGTSLHTHTHSDPQGGSTGQPE